VFGQHPFFFDKKWIKPSVDKEKKETNNTFVFPTITIMGTHNIMGLSPIEN
jgi:hypothetical protein